MKKSGPIPTHLMPQSGPIPTHLMPQIGKSKEFHCPNGSSYSCSPGSVKDCGLASTLANCCSSDEAAQKLCPFTLSKPQGGGGKKTYKCSSGESYSCYPGTKGCMPDNPDCCLLGSPGKCPYQLTPAHKKPPHPPHHPPKPPHPPHHPPKPPDVDIDICLHAHASLCPLILESCKSAPQNPLCMAALQECPTAVANMDRAREAPWML